VGSDDDFCSLAWRWFCFLVLLGTRRRGRRAHERCAQQQPAVAAAAAALLLTTRTATYLEQPLLAVRRHDEMRNKKKLCGQTPVLFFGGKK
jgi:hypothetical protein